MDRYEVVEIELSQKLYKALLEQAQSYSNYVMSVKEFIEDKLEEWYG